MLTAIPRCVSWRCAGQRRRVLSRAYSSAPNLIRAAPLPAVALSPLLERTARATEELSQPQKPLLVLAFDINKTIVAVDKAAKKSVEEILSVALADNAMGYVEGGNWFFLAPSKATLTEEMVAGKAPDRVMSYTDFMDLCFPDIPGNDNRGPKRSRDLYKSSFVYPGSPGEAMYPEFSKLLRHLQLPGEMKGSPYLAQAGLDMGMFFIIPAFYVLLEKLVTEGVEFRLQFRTFGHDLDKVAREFNAFCEGRHPLSRPGLRLDGTSPITNGIDYRVHFSTCGGSFFRSHTRSEFCVGKYSADEKTPGVKIQTISAFHEWQRAMYSVGKTPENRKIGTLAIRDYWPHWRACLESADSGKLITIDREGQEVPGGMRSLRTIFFDDNVYPKEEQDIADVRFHDGSLVPFQLSHGKHLVRANLCQALRSPETYFYDEITQRVAL